uniref:Uncharacterized protein n=1 Tax=Trieres chinensis TaxID=1514140 RepID=A0A7S2EPM2_TRICV|mmetsp:Transcript_33039/g.67423  ORF Transcript_33039/g.67423 Transcript_33039/m.67423 type:complete len:708 (+) Transcript_33039:195-2318(+)
MKLPLVESVLLSAAVSSAAGTATREDSVFRPHRVSLSDLRDASSTSSSGASLLEALRTHGVVAVRDISSTYASDKNRSLKALHGCANSSPEDGIKTAHFKDGTSRRTVASKTVPGPGGMQKIKVQGSGACNNFVSASDDLRGAMDGVVQAFSNRLGSLLDLKGGPLLSTQDGSHDFMSFGDVAEAGEHLEHFHSYVKLGNNEMNKSENVRKLVKEDTIELHTDQGLFIAFTPAQIAGSDGELSPSGGFYVQDPETGNRLLAEFHPDDVIFMLGDGVEQIGLNDRLRGMGEEPLRPVPHALVMPEGVNDGSSSSVSRVWHGRMVLPPSGAVIPSSTTETFGDVRRSLASSSSEASSHRTGLGCSSPTEAARLLAEEEPSCADDATYCWHRCMPHEESGVSLEICSERNLRLQCVNPRDQVYVSGHGDFYPACSNTTAPVTDFPTLPNYPRSEEVCNDVAWEAFSTTTGYDHSFDRLGDNRGNRGFWEGAAEKGNGKVAKFMWNVGEDGKTIEGKLVFNGIFGYLALGLANLEDESKNGMMGASVIMGLPGADYTGMNGLDLTKDGSVQEYQVHPKQSPFRYWQDPLPDRDTSTYSFTSTDCFTSISFTTDTINDIPLVAEDGTGSLVWSGNTKDAYCQYHGRGDAGQGDRDRFTVNWTTGEGWFPAEDKVDLDNMDGLEGEDPKDPMSSAARTAASLGFVALGLVLSL